MYFWNRADLKERARTAMKANYWWCVLVAVVLAIILGGGSSGRDDSDGDDGGLQAVRPVKSFHVTVYFREDGMEILRQDLEKLEHLDIRETVENAVWTVLRSGIYLVLGIFGVILGLVLKLLLINPLQVGCRKFFFVNACSPDAGPALMGDAFKNGYYGNTVVAMLLRDLYVFLWTLLLVVPGIIKAYEYRLVPYLMAEYPEMHYREALDKSRMMMEGEKWNAFVLDLSFIGWSILSALTGGLVGIFWTNPYRYAADAELYLTLSGRG